MTERLAPIYVNRKLLKDFDEPKPTVFAVVKATGRDPNTCDVFRLKSENDEKGEPIELTAILDRTVSDQPIYLRCVPKDRNVGQGPAPDRLVADVETLKSNHYKVDLTVESARVYAKILGFPLPAGRFNKPATDLLVIVPLPYPEAKLDMFYTDPDVTLSGGAIPKGAETLEQHDGRNWRRFSWHTGSWNPAVDDLLSHISFVQQRLAEVD